MYVQPIIPTARRICPKKPNAKTGIVKRPTRNEAIQIHWCLCISSLWLCENPVNSFFNTAFTFNLRCPSSPYVTSIIRIKLSLKISEVFFLPSGDSISGYSETSSPDIAKTGATRTGKPHGIGLVSVLFDNSS